MLAKDVMTCDVVTVTESTPVTEIARLMAENGVSGVPVVDNDNCIVGMVSEDDLILKHDQFKVPHRLALFGLWVVPDETLRAAYKSARGRATARDVMTRKVITFEPEDDVRAIAEVMVKKKINRAPVVRDCKLVGIVTRADILRGIAGERSKCDQVSQTDPG